MGQKHRISFMDDPLGKIYWIRNFGVGWCLGFSITRLFQTILMIRVFVMIFDCLNRVAILNPLEDHALKSK